MGHPGASGAVETATAQAASAAGVDVDASGVCAQNGSGDDGFGPLRIKRVVRETGDTVSQVFDVPASHAQRFCYEAGQIHAAPPQGRFVLNRESVIFADALALLVDRHPEVAEGWVLTCQSFPTSASVTVIYE